MADNVLKQEKEKGDELLKRMLKTPPKPKLKTKPENNMEFIVLDGRVLVAQIWSRNNRSITADLYRNLDNFNSGDAMERDVRLSVTSHII